jgi:archaellum biogenesis ATPase FlaH
MNTKLPDMILLNEDNIEDEINVIKMNNETNDVHDINDSDSDNEHNEDFLEESNTIGYESIQFDQLPQENDAHNQNLEELDNLDDLIKTDLVITSEFVSTKTNDEIDYKKMSLNKLREIVVQKKLVNDASKLKKNDLLKVLETH